MNGLFSVLFVLSFEVFFEQCIDPHKLNIFHEKVSTFIHFILTNYCHCSVIRFRLNKICSILFYFRCSVIPKCIYELNKHAKTCAIHFFGKPTFVFNSSDFRPKIRRIFDEFSTNCQFDENFRRIFDKLSFRQNVTFDQSLHSTKWFSTKCHGSVSFMQYD